MRDYQHDLRAPRRKTSYDFDVILDGRPHLLESGVDFTIAASSVRAYIYQEALRRNMTATTKAVGNDIAVQAFPNGDTK